MDHGFKFKIGDITSVVGTASVSKRDTMMLHLEDQRWLVVEQRLQVCHGGEQRFYLCRGIYPGGSVHKDFILFGEPELEPSEPFEPAEGRDKIKTR